MTLYGVVGTVNESEWFYGVFSTLEKANQIKEELESKPWFGQDDEKLSVEEITVDKPREAYYWMTAE